MADFDLVKRKIILGGSGLTRQALKRDWTLPATGELMDDRVRGHREGPTWGGLEGSPWELRAVSG